MNIILNYPILIFYLKINNKKKNKKKINKIISLM